MPGFSPPPRIAIRATLPFAFAAALLIALAVPAAASDSTDVGVVAEASTADARDGSTGGEVSEGDAQATEPVGAGEVDSETNDTVDPAQPDAIEAAPDPVEAAADPTDTIAPGDSAVFETTPPDESTELAPPPDAEPAQQSTDSFGAGTEDAGVGAGTSPAEPPPDGAPAIGSGEGRPAPVSCLPRPEAPVTTPAPDESLAPDLAADPVTTPEPETTADLDDAVHDLGRIHPADTLEDHQDGQRRERRAAMGYHEIMTLTPPAAPAEGSTVASTEAEPATAPAAPEPATAPDATPTTPSPDPVAPVPDDLIVDVPLAAPPIAAIVANPGSKAVAVAVEFGKSGSGWAGTVVFNIWLRRQLRERRMTQRQLAALAGVNHSMISRLLRGERSPSLATATRLAHALRITATDEELAHYFDLLAERAPFPTQRVEAALRGDDQLDDDDVRELMLAYLRARNRPRSERREPDRPFQVSRPLGRPDAAAAASRAAGETVSVPPRVPRDQPAGRVSAGRRAAGSPRGMRRDG